MTDVIQQYLSTPSSSRIDSPETVSAWLAELDANADFESSVSETIRTKFSRALVQDIGNHDCKWNSDLKWLALKVLKQISRLGGTSLPLAEKQGLQSLLLQVQVPLPKSKVSSEATVDWKVTDMALRCLNNALFLNESSRSLFISEEVAGGHVAIALLSNPQDTPADILFLGSRLLFFSTLFESPFNRTAVESLDLINVQAKCTRALVQAILYRHCVDSGKVSNDGDDGSCLLESNSSLSQLHTALSDLLKAHFNVCLYYPRLANSSSAQQDDKPILGESYHDALDSMLLPILELIIHLPIPTPISLQPPFTHAIASLLNYPLTVENRHHWLITSDETSSNIQLSTPISSISTSTLLETPSLIVKLIQIIDSMFYRYLSPSQNKDFMEDPDDKSVQNLLCKDGIDLEQTIQPVLLVLRKLALQDDRIRYWLRLILFPKDLDRSKPMNQRLDLTGRLVNIMSSVMFSSLARVSAELLLAIFNSDAKQMSQTIGYGPCAGFFMNSGLGSTLPSSTSTSSSINPITGQFNSTPQKDTEEEMSEQEKLLEAEKLFVLFDRLNKTGIISVQSNPITAAATSQFDDQDDEIQRIKQQEIQDEVLVESEMKKYKSGKRM